MIITKQLRLLVLLGLFTTFTLQAQSRRINKVLNNSEDRAYMMQKISNDKKLRTEMIKNLSNNVEAVQQLKKKFGKKKGMMVKDGIRKEKMDMCPMCKEKMKQKKMKKMSKEKANKEENK